METKIGFKDTDPILLHCTVEEWPTMRKIIDDHIASVTVAKLVAEARQSLFPTEVYTSN